MCRVELSSTLSASAPVIEQDPSHFHVWDLDPQDAQKFSLMQGLRYVESLSHRALTDAQWGNASGRKQYRVEDRPSLQIRRSLSPQYAIEKKLFRIAKVAVRSFSAKMTLADLAFAKWGWPSVLRTSWLTVAGLPQDLSEAARVLRLIPGPRSPPLAAPFRVRFSPPCSPAGRRLR